MARLKMAQFVAPLEPIEWPDGTEQPVKHLAWAEQEMLADMEDGTLPVREAMPKVMPALLPGKSWEQIREALDMEAMRAVIAYASGKYEQAMKAMEEALGNGAAGAAPASPPPTQAPTSLPALPANTGAPCGTL